MDAVVFDLFGTLTDPAFELARRAMVDDTAQALGLDPAEFWAHWSSSFPARIVGDYGGTSETLTRLAGQCGVQIEAAQLQDALARHLESMEAVRRPRPGALAVLDELRSRGFRLALMSDCSSEVVESWGLSPYAPRFDATVLSWNEGIRKPDPRLYARAAARLGVAAARCWYVGDGGGRELSGAVAAGMTPVLVTNARVPGAAALRADADEYQPALRVDELDDLLAVIGHPR